MNEQSRSFKIKRSQIAIIILLILAFVYFGMIPFFYGGKKMKTFCIKITPGMQTNEVYKLIEQTQYKFLENKEGAYHTIIIIDSKAMGRFICEVTLDQDKVIDATYVYND
jgi:hypothetical protein